MRRAPAKPTYPASMKALARRMYGDGDAWNPTQIQRYIAATAEPGQPVPSRTTIRLWVRDDLAEDHRAADRARRQVARARAVLALHDALPPVDEDMRRLHNAGLTYTAIAKALEVYHGVTLSADQVRYALNRRAVRNRTAAS